MWNNKQRKLLESSFGQPPEVHYFAGDMAGICTYFNYRYANNLDDFLIDDITYRDLALDKVFQRINMGLSTSGEQYLYYLLRSPAVTQGEYDKRLNLLKLMENNPDLRLKLQVILAGLGKKRAANTCEAFSPSAHSLKKLWLYLLLVLALIGSGIAAAFAHINILPFICLLIFLPLYHQFAAERIEADLATVNYSVAMAYAQTRIKNLSSPELDAFLTPFYEAGKGLKTIARLGGIPTNSSVNEVTNIINNVLLLDLIMYELVKNRLGKHHREIFCIHEYLGRIDSAIAIASYRKSLGVYANPHIAFPPTAEARFNGVGLVHPLLKNAVPNSLDTEKPILLTGSNASGKSTFLKTVAINAVLAQGICTALGRSYVATAFRVYSSMAMADDLLAGESYYIAEIKSLKRIMDAAAAEEPILCVIDEVLRGTNTAERIAASSELLQSMADQGLLCLAATHDGELCAMLANVYTLLHFEETVMENGSIEFDYILKEGPATTRNALKLLSSMGFEEEIIARANEKANQYMLNEKWT